MGDLLPPAESKRQNDSQPGFHVVFHFHAHKCVNKNSLKSLTLLRQQRFSSFNEFGGRQPGELVNKSTKVQHSISRFDNILLWSMALFSSTIPPTMILSISHFPLSISRLSTANRLSLRSTFFIMLLRAINNPSANKSLVNNSHYSCPLFGGKTSSRDREWKADNEKKRVHILKSD
jgi:hypothetical protein